MENGRRGKDLRIGDPERESAMRLLGEHFSAGRLDVHEYDERCQQVATARFRSELNALFEDLPEPQPNAPSQQTPAARTAMPPAAGKIVLAICATVMVIFLVVVARQLAPILLIPLIAVLWLYWRR
ncbi:DUF1707 SHOCT-like domain-containing protein [Saccharopolyspora spinosa]|uniref:Uncharacterized protein DUF1707 n=1 Tax=Saccharopolyspora spinosa TaxID=60894 RepID=A0A2N3XPM1_SACSN|nr:DUF1707 domain-containing protein [Saccharopolyspora spinosa]PKW12615.1 uncharacterized protein DUF1707 [Saccharopolyspora spinosa]